MRDGCGSAAGGVEKRERDAEGPVEGEPPRKVACQEVASSDGREADAEVAAPYIGYQLEDAEEGNEENDGADDNYIAFLCRVAEMEAALRQSARAHQFRMTLATQEKEALHKSIVALRSSLVESQETRQKASQDAAKTGGAEKDAESQEEKETPVDLAVLLKACDGATRAKRLSTHLHLLQGLEKCRDHVTDEQRTASIASGSWMPTPSLTEVDTSFRQPCHAERQKFEDLRGAMEKAQGRFDAPVARVMIALQNEIQRLCAKSDALSEIKASLESQAKALMVRWNEHVLWGTERSLLVAEEKMRSHLLASHPPFSEQQLFLQQKQLQKRLHRTELALAALLAAITGTHLKPMTPAALQATLSRQQELESLRDRLSREVFYLRKLLRDKLVAPSRLVCDPSLAAHTTATAEEGKTVLLQHFCASLAGRLAELTEGIVSELLEGSTACATSAEQEERLFFYETKAGTLHASIVAFLTENVRLQQEIKDAALIKVMATPDSNAVMLLAERLQTLLHCKRNLEHGEEEEEEEEEEEGDSNDRKCEKDENEEELDEQKLLVDIFMESTAGLLKLLNAHLYRATDIFRGEKHGFKETALLLRMIIAADRLLLGKAGVPPAAGFTYDIVEEMEEAHVRFKPPKNILQQLPSLNTLQETFESHSRRHAAHLLTQYRDAERTRKELQEDVEWCRQQSPQNVGADLRGAQKELQNLKTALLAAVTREKEVASLEIELVKSREKLAEVRLEKLALEQELATAEEQLRMAQETEESGNNKVMDAPAPFVLPPPDPAEGDESIHDDDDANG
ncbi:hypothetical protein MOQ_003158 [Trypanosoma cruzi marinkellei]|uniref:Uncharacterized protein n=1 Tax=Trypanosoma cruzi marinkellei TaxID=85056 RepID=K2NVK8_TRYCR|nr:hypothetical protein MOQ_003158 [Trypanosoma cruzi marinkellei]